MLKTTIVGDPHAKPNNLELIEKLFDIVEELNNPTIWLGDFLDTKELVRGKCLNLLYCRLKNSKLEHYILVGNHDYFNLDLEDHSLQLLKELKHVKIVDKPTMLTPSIYAIPYIHGKKELQKTLSEIPKDIVLFGHLELKGFDYGNGQFCDGGLTERSFKKFKRVISGHFHRFQNKGNLTYLGTPFSHSFGETNQDKFIGIYHSDTDTLDLKPTKDLFPRHMTIEIDCDDPNQTIEETSDSDHIRVIYSGSQENIDKAKANLKFPEKTKIIERPKDELQEGVQIEETLDNKVKFNKWAKDIRELDGETIKLGMDILEVVK